MSPAEATRFKHLLTFFNPSLGAAKTLTVGTKLLAEVLWLN